MKRRVGLLVASSAVVALVIAACGGGESTPTSVPPTATATRPTPPAAAQPTATSPAPQATTAAPRAPTPTPAPATATPPPTASGAQPKSGGTLRTRSINDWASWDSYSVAGASSVQVFMNAFSNLIISDIQKPSLLLPEVAERWEVSSNGGAVTFFIRKGVKWHDGKDLTARDVVWNLERAMKGDAPVTFNKGRFLNVASVEATDDFTVKVTMKQPSASFLPNMAVPYMLMYAPQGPGPSTSEFKENPIGTGPFKIKSYGKNVKWEFVRNDGYYKKDDAGRTLPYLDGITMFILPDPASGLAAFRSGQIDCGCGYELDFLTANYDSIKKDMPGVKLQIGNAAIIRLVFNQKAPWTDVRVRKAVWAALDRVKVRDLYRGGRGAYPPAYFLGPELGGKWGLPASEMLQVPGFRLKDGKKDPGDLDLSKQLFKDAGVDPTKLTAIVAGISGSTVDSWEIIAAAVQDATGMKTDLKLDDTASNAQRKQQLQMDIYAIYGQDVLDDPSDAGPRFALSNSPENFPKWQRPEIDALYQRAEGELDSAKRLQLTYDLQRKLLDEAVSTPLQYIVAAWGTQPQVFGFTAGAFTTGPHFRLERVWIDTTVRS